MRGDGLYDIGLGWNNSGWGNHSWAVSLGINIWEWKMKCKPVWSGAVGVLPRHNVGKKPKMSEWTIRYCTNTECDCGDLKIENRCRHCGKWTIRKYGEYLLCTNCHRTHIKDLNIKLEERKPRRKNARVGNKGTSKSRT